MDSSNFDDDFNISESKNWFASRENSTKEFFVRYNNTRIEIKLKNLFVDLSNSKIPSRENNAVENTQLLQISRSLQRRERCISQESSVFDFSEMNDSGRTCYNVCNIPRNKNCWKKYCYGMCLIGSLYVIILIIHQGELLRNLSKHIDILKLQVDNADSETELYKLENVVNNIKEEQESLKKSLKELVNAELAIYSADKTGRTDFALESSGGKIVSLSADTENFDYAKTLFGITLCEGMHGPRAMLQPEMYPGHCWAFKGSKGGAIIKLIGKVIIDAVSIEHISENVSPTGEITSAPKKFVVFGLRNPSDKGYELGQFSYDVYGPQVQIFDIQNHKCYEYVEFKVLSNYENSLYTCVYRFRVHGTLDKM